MCSFSSAIFLRVSIAETLFSNKLGRTNETLFGQVPNVIGGKKVTSIVTYQLFISTDFRSTFKINGTKENYVIQIICVKIKHLQISQQYSNKKNINLSIPYIILIEKFLMNDGIKSATERERKI